MQIKPHKWYKSRNGLYAAFVVDTNVTTAGDFTVKAQTVKLSGEAGHRTHYTKDGHYWDDGSESELDLVEATASPFAPTKVKIVVEGGCVVSVESDKPIEYKIEDHDI